MSHQQAPKRAEPGDRAFDDPAAAVAAMAPPILVGSIDAVAPIWADQSNVPCEELPAMFVAIVGEVADQMPRIASVRHDAALQRRVEERDFARRRRGNGDSHRKTLTLDQYHAL